MKCFQPKTEKCVPKMGMLKNRHTHKKKKNQIQGNPTSRIGEGKIYAELITTSYR